MRSFAITLQFYSSKAYNFVRKTLNLALPHPAQIRKWYRKVPAEPGFMEPAFDALQASVISAREKGHEVLCSLMIYEMAIHTHGEWDGQTYCWFVDLGTGIDYNDSLPIAKDALVFMVVAVNSTWKNAYAYFLVNGLSGIEYATLIKICPRKVLEVGVTVISLTCDGPSCHFSMLSELGVNLNPYN